MKRTLMTMLFAAVVAALALAAHSCNLMETIRKLHGQ
jgi:hypothetical protein